LDVYNPAGSLVAKLAQGYYPAGIHRVVWKDSTEDQPLPPTGLYFVTMETAGFSQTRKLMLIK